MICCFIAVNKRYSKFGFNLGPIAFKVYLCIIKASAQEMVLTKLFPRNYYTWRFSLETEALLSSRTS